MKKVTNKRINKVNKLPLNDVICCVETFNSDGVDSSLSNIKILQELGAKIETGGIRSGLTHMIWSNGNIKHLKAAEIMDIIVVSPLWIEQCQESKTKANESDFLITSDSVIISDKKSKIQEPIPHVANNLPEPDSPSLDSTKRLSSGSTSTSKSLNTNNKNNKNNDNQKKGQKNNENKTSNEKKNIKNKKTKNNLSDSEDDNHDKNNDNDNSNDDSNDDMELENKKQTKKISNTSTTTSNSNRPSFIAISGFSGEERIFLADLVESIMSCISTSSSNNSTTTTVKKTINYGLIDDEDRSITALTSTAFVISSTIDQVRSLRILYAMVLGIPVVTQEWLHACLENHDWVNVTPFLHPRFDRSSKLNGKVNTKRKTLDDSIGIYVGVSTSSNPSVEIVRGLVENWNLTHLVNNPNDADYIIVDNQKSKSPTIYEMRSVIAHLFQESNGFNSTISDYIINLLEKGKVLTCKTFFDCIEAGKITPHPFPTSQLPETNEKKRSISDIIDIDNDSDEEKDNIIKQTKKQPRIENNKSSTTKNSNRKQSTPKKNNKRNIIDDESEDDNEKEEEKEEEDDGDDEEIQKNSKNKKGKNNINKVDTKTKSLNSTNSNSKSKSKLSPIKSKEKLSNNKGNKKNEEKNTNNENIDGWIDSSPNKKNGKLSTNTTTTTTTITPNHSLLNKTNDNKNTKKRSIQSIINDDDDEDDNDKEEKEEESNNNKNTSIVNKKVTKKSNKTTTPSTPISSSSSNLIATPTPIKNNSNNLGDDLGIDSSILGQVTEESPSW